MVSISRALPGRSDTAEMLSMQVLIQSLAVGVVVFLSALVSIVVIPMHTHAVTPIWLSNAVALAYVLRGGPDRASYIARAVVGGSAVLLAELIGRGVTVLTFAFTAANVAEIAAAAILVRSYLPLRFDLAEFKSLLIFLMSAAVAAPLVSALIAAMAAYLVHGAKVSQVWVSWYSADALGMAIVGPLALTFNLESWSWQSDYPSRTDLLAVAGMIVAATGASMYCNLFLMLLVPTILISASRLGLSWTAAVTLCIAAFGNALILGEIGHSLMPNSPIPDRLIAFQFFLAVTVLCAFPVAAMVAENKRLLSRVRSDNRRLADEGVRKSQMLMDLHRTLIRAEERERLRLARELHDETAQTLAVSLMQLKRLEPLVQTAGRRVFERLRGLLEDIGKTLHHVAWQLRPTSIDDCGLAQAVQHYMAQWNSHLNIEIDFHCSDPDIDRISMEIRLALFRFVQEALTNVSKHADASLVSVVIERVEGTLHVSVEDNGRGFDPDRIETDGHSGLGLLGMRERIALLDGVVEVQSSPGSGTTVFARIPLGSEEQPS